MAQQDSSNGWYYVDSSNERRGPLSRDSLQLLHKTGRVKEDSLVWVEGMEEWKTFSSVFGASVPPPLPNTDSALGPAEKVQKTDEPEERKKVKVRGWLILFCVLLAIVFPLSSCSGMAEHTDLAVKHGVDPRSQVYAALGQNALGGVLAGIYGFVAGLRIWLGSPKGKRIAITFLCLYPLIMLLSNLVALDMVGNAQGAEAVRLELLKSTIGPFVFSAVWLAYFRWSKRVKVTYGPAAGVQ